MCKWFCTLDCSLLWKTLDMYHRCVISSKFKLHFYDIQIIRNNLCNYNSLQIIVSIINIIVTIENMQLCYEESTNDTTIRMNK